MKRNIYNFDTQPVVPAVYETTYDDDGNETGTTLISEASSEVVGLVVTTTEAKSLKDIERVIALNKPQLVVDKFIGLYIPTLEPAQITMDLWLRWTKELEGLSPEEPYVLKDPEVPDVYLDRTYDLKTAELTYLVTENPWVLRAELPEATITVDSFKASNSSMFTRYSKSLGIELSGKVLSINESNQNGIAAVLTGLNLAEELGLSFEPFSFKAETSTGTTSILFSTLMDYKVFAMQFMAERRKFF